MAHMKCVCFLQNNEESLEALEEELKEPKYGEYYLCQLVNLLRYNVALLLVILTEHCLDFSNILGKSAIERLAQVDEYEVVREVQVRNVLPYKLYLSTTEFLFCRSILRTMLP
jgi:hypothetical protein